MPACTTIIVTYNSVGTINRCLDSIKPEFEAQRTKVIVVDNASQDRTAELIASNYPWVQLIRSPVNGGFGAGNNLGLHEVATDYIFFLNPDSYVLPGAIQDLIEFLRAHSNAGCVGPAIVDKDKKNTVSYQPFITLWISIWVATGFHRLLPLNRKDGKLNFREPPVTKPVRVDRIIGAAMMVKRSAMEQVGRFDERFFLYSEEEDLCYRMLKSDLYTYYYPAAKVQHSGAESTQQFEPLSVAATVWSRHLYMKKHHSRLETRMSQLIWILMLVARLILMSLGKLLRPDIDTRGYVLALRSLTNSEYFDSVLRPPR